MNKYVTCETTAAVTLHARVVTDVNPVQYGGHSATVLALCGRQASWDMRSPLKFVTCRPCLEALKLAGGSHSELFAFTITSGAKS